jgi:O-antigen ligase
MIERLSGGFFDQVDNSTSARLIAATENLEKFGDHPVIGIGLGGSLGEEFTIGSHNLLLRMASELGILGVLVYLSLLIVPLVAGSKQGFIFVVIFYISNLFTHTSFEKSTYAILVPFAILNFVAHTTAKRKRKKRRSRPVQMKSDRYFLSR